VETPSCEMVVGDRLIVRECDTVDGPVSPGTSV
jgi:hypothetical protein